MADFLLAALRVTGRSAANNQTPTTAMDTDVGFYEHREPWNKGKSVGQQVPLTAKYIRAICILPGRAYEALAGRHGRGIRWRQ